MTKTEVIAKIAAVIAEGFAKVNERNQKSMERDGCSQEAIDFVRKQNDAPAIQHVVLVVLGRNLVGGPETSW
jgi:hypothetical protein